MIAPNITLEVLCSAQRALLGAITPNLRAVSVLLETENAFYLIFYYSEGPSEKEMEIIELSSTYFSADFPPPNYETFMEINVIPEPQSIPRRGRLVYERYDFFS